MRRLGVASAAAGYVAAAPVADIVRSVTFRAQDGDRTETVREALAGGVARNIFLFIGDGMGDSEITAARNYAVGASGRLAMDTLPLTGHYTTYAVQGPQAANVVGISDQTDLFRTMLRAMPREVPSR